MARMEKGLIQLRLRRVPLGMTLVVVWVLLMASLTDHGVEAATTTTDVNECDQDPCVNAYYCFNTNASYTCVCKKGWTGKNCTEDVDECSAANMHDCKAHSTCLNNNGSYTCPCDEGYERLSDAVSCTEQVLLPFNSSLTTREHGDQEIFGPFSIPNGFRLDNGNYVWMYYISIDGYLTFNYKFSRPRMPDVGSPRLSNVLFLAPYWADIDIPASSQDEGVTSGLYHVALSLNDTFYNNDTKALFDDYKKAVEFEPVFIAVVTWVDVLPYKADNFPNFQAATFQVALFTDGKQTTARLAWRSVWPETANLKVSAAMSFSEQSVTSLTFAGTPRKENVTIGTDQDHVTTTAQCVQWLATEGKHLPSKPRVICPRSLQQARTYAVLEVNEATKCATSKVVDVSGLKTVCCYSATGSVDTSDTAKLPLLANPSTTGTGSNGRDPNAVLAEGFSKCCNKTTTTPSFCSGFRKIFPRPLRVWDTWGWELKQASIWGSLHIAGYKLQDLFAKGLEELPIYGYTFNGWGEYRVLKSDDENGPLFEIQMRTEKLPDLNVTVIKTFAMKYSDHPVADIVLVPGGTLKLYVNGTEMAPHEIPPSYGIAAKYLTPDKVLEMVIPTGAALQVTAGTDRLSLTITWSDSGLGLLGLLTMLAANVSEAGLGVFQLGKAFHIAQNESLFRYAENGTNGDYASFQHPDFVPSFGPPLVEQETALNETNNAVCSGRDFDLGGQQCIEDIMLTGSDQRAQESRDTVQALLENARSFEVTPPRFIDSPVWFLGTTPLTFTKKFRFDEANVTMTVSAVTGLNFTLEQSTEYDWRFVWHVTKEELENITQWTLSFQARSLLTNMTTEHSPHILACMCTKNHQCDDTIARKSFAANFWSEEGKLYMKNCQCQGIKGGPFCQEDVDFCDKCFENATCRYNFNGKLGACIRCPQGYSGNGLQCYDVDECQKDACDQVCTNTLGSYICSCYQGYDHDGNDKCKDVDECQGATTCDYTQICHNMEPGYACVCRPGLFLVNGTCKRAVATFVGVITFLSMPGQEWSLDLKYPDSQKYKVLVETVEKAIAGSLRKTNVDVLGVKVISLGLESNSRKRRSVATSEEPMVQATYQIGTVHKQNVTELSKAVTSGFEESCSSSLCPYGGLLQGVSTSDSGIDVNFDLCSDNRTNDCHASSTECITQDGQALCQCRQGYEEWGLSDSVCQDVDECQRNTTLELCGVAETSGASCNNFAGSYYCTCPKTHQWNTTAMACSAKRNLCVTDNPCLNGAECVSTEDMAGTACRCKDGWGGLYCGDDTEADASETRKKMIIIGTVLGCLCLILIIALVVMVMRRRRREKDGGSQYEISTSGPGSIHKPSGGEPQSRL